MIPARRSLASCGRFAHPGCGGTCGPCAAGSACDSVGKCQPIPACPLGEYLTFTLYRDATGYRVDPASCAVACDPVVRACTTDVTQIVEEVYDGCIISSFGQYSSTTTFNPPLKVPGTCYPDPNGTYSGEVGTMTVTGTPSAAKFAGTLGGQSLARLYFGGTFIANHAIADFFTNETGAHLDGKLDPATGKLAGQYCWTDCRFCGPVPIGGCVNFDLTRVPTIALP